MKTSASLPLCAITLILLGLSGCVAVPFAGDRVTVKAKDTTMLVIVDLDLLSNPDSLVPFTSCRVPAQKSSRIASDAVSPENAPSHGTEGEKDFAIPLHKNARRSDLFPSRLVPGASCQPTEEGSK